MLNWGFHTLWSLILISLEMVNKVSTFKLHYFRCYFVTISTVLGIFRFFLYYINSIWKKEQEQNTEILRQITQEIPSTRVCLNNFASKYRYKRPAYLIGCAVYLRSFIYMSKFYNSEGSWNSHERTVISNSYHCHWK